MFSILPQVVANGARAALVVLGVLAFCAAGKGAGKAAQHGQPNSPDIQYMATTPLGTDQVRLVPSNQVLTMMVTLESKEMEGVKLTHTRSGTMILRDRDGKVVTHFPPELTFRFTVGSRTKLIDQQPLETEFDGTAQEFEDTLQFRLKIFHGVDQVEVEPEWQKIVGVPVEMPYDERIYRVRFKLPEQLPATDRVMLEVIDSEGVRVGKFAVQML